VHHPNESLELSLRSREARRSPSLYESQGEDPAQAQGSQAVVLMDKKEAQAYGECIYALLLLSALFVLWVVVT